MVRPEHFGDHYEWAKVSVLRGLVQEDDWAYHPMYFTHKPIKSFPCHYASFLQVRLVSGDIWKRRKLVDVVKDCPYDLFLDPDKGLWWKAFADDSKRHLRISIDDEMVPIVISSPIRRNKLTLVYDQCANYDPNADGSPQTQIRKKLDHLLGKHIHGAAYVSSLLAFIWVSPDRNVVSKATKRLMQSSGFPPNRFVDDGCGHIAESLQADC